MSYQIFMLILFLAFTVPDRKPTPPQKQVRVIELASKDKAWKLATVYLDDQHVLFTLPDQKESVLFGTQAFFSINHKDRTYRANAYADILDSVRDTVRSRANSGQEAENTAKRIEFKLTENTATILGFKAQQIVGIRDGKSEFEIWVCRDLTPIPLREVGEKMRTTGYLKKILGNLGLIETIISFGVPLKIASNADGSGGIEAVAIRKEHVTEDLFQTPSGYRKVEK